MTDNYVIATAAAGIYRAVHAARTDIGIAIDMIGLVVGDDAEEPADFVEEAAWTTAAIRYARAWKVPLLPEKARVRFLGCLTEAQLAAHQHVMTIRDAMYAHQVGVGIDMTVTAVVGPDSSGKSCLWGMGIQSSRISSPGTNAAKQFLEILQVAHEQLEQLERESHRLALEDLQSRPAEEWILRGIYQKNLQFDIRGATYRREFDKRTPRAKPPRS
ncbi:MAG: hypothetical protein K0M64_11125 [Rhizobium sp.]|nr:hypothetical protein [Rhizobium sp.]